MISGIFRDYYYCEIVVYCYKHNIFKEYYLRVGCPFKSTNNETITGNICEINIIFKDGEKRGQYIDSLLPRPPSVTMMTISIHGPPITQSTACDPQHLCDIEDPYCIMFTWMCV